MSGVRDAVVVAAILTAGLVAGLFAAFAYSVMPGLDRATPSAAIEVMQRINAAILNPVFGLVFGGGLVLAALAAVLAWGGSLRWWALAAFGCYVAGVLITMLFNVPLNVRLDAVGDASGTQPRRPGPTSVARGCGGIWRGPASTCSDLRSSPRAWSPDRAQSTKIRAHSAGSRAQSTKIRAHSTGSRAHSTKIRAHSAKIRAHSARSRAQSAKIRAQSAVSGAGRSSRPGGAR